ncbi:hypothetical protein GXW82_20795 [Streptacidiphilus sp. 4-A2]|nr:hypothetical protein [Streptacidiphilus sp. 4-A2]
MVDEVRAQVGRRRAKLTQVQRPVSLPADEQDTAPIPVTAPGPAPEQEYGEFGPARPMTPPGRPPVPGPTTGPMTGPYPGPVPPSPPAPGPMPTGRPMPTAPIPPPDRPASCARRR